MKTIGVIVLFFFGYSIFAQNFELNFRNISVQDGLSHSDVTSVVQDKQGFIWIGTLSGLNRYDGFEIKGFANSNILLQSVYKNRIIQLLLDEDLIWMATQGGLDCFSISKETYLNLTWELADTSFEINGEVKSVFISDTRKLYIIYEEGLKAFEIIETDQSKHIKLKEYPISKSQGKHTFFDLKKDNNGINWVISETGLFHLEDKKNEIVIKEVKVTDGNRTFSDFTGFYAKEINYLLIGVENGFLKANTSATNLNKLPELSTTFYKIENNQNDENSSKESNFTVNNFERGINNTLWIGSSIGLIRATPQLNGYEYEFYNDYNNVMTPNISDILSLFRDESDCLWVSNYEGGVYLSDLHQKKFYSLRYNGNSQNSLSEKYVRAIAEDQFGNLWIGSEKLGLNYYDFKRNEFSHFKHSESNPNSLIGNNIRALLVDKEKRVWIGTMDGISIYNPKNKLFFNINNTSTQNSVITDNVIFTLDEDKFGAVWAGSWLNGLNKIKFKDTENIEIQKIYKKNGNEIGLSSNVVTFVHADKYFPEIFVGTDNGLNHIFLNENGSIKDIIHYKGDNSFEQTLSSNFIWPIVRENDSIVWVGTLGGGLNQMIFNKKYRYSYKAKSYSINEGAPSTDIESILLDRKNSELWMGGVGLSRFNFDTKEFSNYNSLDGLVGDSYKVGSAHKGNSGRFYFGGTDGLNYFYPQDIVPNLYLPKIIITDLLVNNKKVIPKNEGLNKEILSVSVQYQEEVDLNHLQNNFQINFATSHFANPQKTKFKYKLNGYDKNWISVNSKNRKAAYSNLPYGTYIFRSLEQTRMVSGQIKSNL